MFSSQVKQDWWARIVQKKTSIRSNSRKRNRSPFGRMISLWLNSCIIYIIFPKNNKKLVPKGSTRNVNPKGPFTLSISLNTDPPDTFGNANGVLRNLKAIYRSDADTQCNWALYKYSTNVSTTLLTFGVDRPLSLHNDFISQLHGMPVSFWLVVQSLFLCWYLTLSKWKLKW